jgi:hypothetical protein
LKKWDKIGGITLSNSGAITRQYWQRIGQANHYNITETPEESY